MLKKFALPAALSMALVASVPVLAQDGYETQFAPVEGSGITYADPNRAFDCSFLNYEPSSVCIADEDGFYTTSSGIRFPVGENEEDAYRAYIQYGGVPGSEPRPGPAA